MVFAFSYKTKSTPIYHVGDWPRFCSEYIAVNFAIKVVLSWGMFGRYLKDHDACVWQGSFTFTRILCDFRTSFAIFVDLVFFKRMICYDCRSNFLCSTVFEWKIIQCCPACGSGLRSRRKVNPYSNPRRMMSRKFWNFVNTAFVPSVTS